MWSWVRVRRLSKGGIILDTGCRTGPLGIGMLGSIRSVDSHLILMDSGAVFLAVSYEMPIARAFSCTKW